MTVTDTSISDLLSKAETLDPELQPYVGSMDNGWMMLRHPLLYSVPYVEGTNALLNAQFRARKSRVDEHRKSGDWSGFLILHERPWRLDAFLQVAASMSNQEYWKHLAWLWIDSENIWENGSAWRSLLNSPRPERPYLQTDTEREALQQMPSTIRVYRGCCTENRKGLSWTIDRDKAEWFSRRQFGRQQILLQGDTQKDGILAYFTARGESEIVVDPKRVHLRS